MVTKFVARPEWEHDREKGFPEEEKDTQGEALEAAKRLALASGRAYVVEIEKRLVQGERTPLKVIPEASERGAWKFWGEARC